MKVLIIPDVHLKPWMFTDAETVMSETGADRAVCLGDLVDDFGCGGNEALYQQTLDGALAFERRHSDTLWCFGNHDLAYLWNVSRLGTGRKKQELLMELSEEELRNYYRGVAKDLTEDGVTGVSEEEIVEKLMNNPDNPFRPLSKEELYQGLEASMKDISEGKTIAFEEAMEQLRKNREKKAAVNRNYC